MNCKQSAHPQFLCLLSVSIVLITFTTACDNGLYRDENGFYHGTGVAEYRYSSGQVMRADKYESGVIIESKWFKPDGTLIATTNVDGGKGVDYHLYDDGTIKVMCPVVDMLWHGKATFYDRSGNLTKVAIYERGVEVGR